MTQCDDVEIVLAPPFPMLPIVGAAIANSSVQLAAQNVHQEPSGAYTGEVSVPMLQALGCQYAIVGHSERRALFAESNELIAQKVAALLGNEIRPIVCVGEQLQERESGETFGVIGEQLAGSLAQVSTSQAQQLVIAYEPVWAIGTGKTATPDTAQEVHQFIREQLEKQFGTASQQIRIQYGGSVKTRKYQRTNGKNRY